MNKAIILQAALIASLSLTGAFAAPVVDGFDFPVGKPNGTGYGVTGWGYLQWTTESVYHPGEDWNGNGGGDSDFGDPVYATASGVVTEAGNYGSGWGNIVEIEHLLPDGSKVWSIYAHLNQIYVTSGDVVKGQTIGTIGKGYNNGLWAHLHFEIRKTNRSAGAWVTGMTQSQVNSLYFEPTAFINANRNLGISPPNSFTSHANIDDSTANGWPDVGLDWEYSGQPDPANTVYRLQISKTFGSDDQVNGFTQSRSAGGSVVVNHIIHSNNPWGSGSSFVWDGSQVANPQLTHSSNGTQISVSEGPLPNTTYYWRVYAYNTQTGQQSNYSPRQQFTTVGSAADTTAPSLSISSPSNGASFSGSTITMSGTSSDNVGVSQVQYRVNSGSWSTASGTTSWSASVTLSPGSNTLEARAIDTSGNPSAIQSRSVTYNAPDTTAPSLSISFPSQGEVFGIAALLMDGTASDNVGVSQVQYRVNSGGWSTASGTTSWSASVTLSPGSNTLEARAIDTSGNPSAIRSRSVTYNAPDTTAPSLSISSPSNGASFSGSTITMSGTASDNVGVSQVQYRVNSGSWSTASGSTSWSASVTLSAGSNSLEARAIDTSGNPSSIQSRSVTYNAPDTTAPSLSISSPSNGASFSGSTITMSGTSSDNVGVSQVQYRVNSGSWSTASGATSWSASVTLSPGSNALEARAIDTSGNPSSIQSRSVTYNVPDTTAPSLSISSPSQGEVFGIAGLLMEGTASDNVGVSQVQYRVNSGSWSPASGTTSWSALVTLSPGSNFLEARAFDTSGNPSAIASRTVTYNAPETTVPILTITSPSNGAVFAGSTITMTGTASDNIGVSQVHYRVNSGSWSTASGATSWSASVTLSPGSNLLEARAFDTSGNPSVIASHTVTYNPADTTIPILTITSPSNGAVLSGSTITMTGTASDNIGVWEVHYRVNSGTWFVASGATSWSASVTLSPGSNLLEARAFDTSGNQSAVASRTATYNPSDTTVPILTITSPSNGAVFAGSTITMTGTASDNIGVSQVHYRVNSGSWSTASGATSWSASVTLSPGSNLLEARAFDTSGNPSAVATRTATYNSPSSSVRISNYQTLGGLSGAAGTTLFYAIAVPAGQRMLRIETFGGDGDADLYVRYGSQPTTVIYDNVSGGGTSTESILIDYPSAGDYHIMVRSYSDTTDVSLRASYSTAANPPSLRIYGSRSIRTSRASVVLRGTATDPDGDLAWVKYRVSGPWRTTSGLALWRANAVLKPGKNRIQVEAGDRTGGRSPVQQVQVFRR